ncbi:GNAT family N-acetyltransferase [Ruegeria arenilitoris]|uniref:GNAT family N-acetyltransferase n=1 Tax=Ruegeria arenilitoris TaxID=1173585 RepID=UPI001479F1B5
MEAILNRTGFRVRPSLAADRMDIATHIFGDVEVSKTLVHNVSTQDGVLVATDAWVDTLAVDGKQNTGNAEHIGLWTIRDEADEGKFVGIRGVFVAPGLPHNSVATFVAVARPYWGKGVSSGSSRLLCRHVFEKSDADAIYTRVWPKLNPASDAVQSRLGFMPAERHTLRDTFGEQRMREVLEFDLWRASHLENEKSAETLRQVSIRVGQLAAEDLLEVPEAEQRILTALPVRLAKSDDVRGKIAEDVKLGFENPAWASYRMSRADWVTLDHL